MLRVGGLLTWKVERRGFKKSCLERGVGFGHSHGNRQGEVLEKVVLKGGLSSGW